MTRGAAIRFTRRAQSSQALTIGSYSAVCGAASVLQLGATHSRHGEGFWCYRRIDVTPLDAEDATVLHRHSIRAAVDCCFDSSFLARRGAHADVDFASMRWDARCLRRPGGPRRRIRGFPRWRWRQT